MTAYLKRKRWFENHPKKTLVITILSLLLLIFAVTKVLTPRKKISKVLNPGIDRYIRLREHPPLLHKTIYPSEKYMALTDSLVRREYLLRVDDQGFIMPAKKHHRPDLTVVFLGGSSTECLLMAEENRFPYLAGTILEKETGKKINAYNGGVGGNNSLHSLDILLNKVIPLKPDIVVMSHNINDLFIILAYDDTYWNNNPYRSPIIVKKEEESYLAKRLRKVLGQIFKKEPEMDEFQHIRGKKLTIDHEKLTSEFLANLQLFIDICKTKKITPVLMTQSNRFKPDPDKFTQRYMKTMETDYGIGYKEFKFSYDLVNDIIREAAKRNHILLIDLAKEVPQERAYLYDILHYNDEGSKLAAKIISEKLKTIIKH